MADMIDLSTVRILNSPDVHDWPATARITRLELRPSGVHIEFTKKTGPDRWPDFPFGDPSEHGTLQYTLWIVLKIGLQLFAAGCIEYWFGLDENGGPVDEYAKNWYFDPNRWAPMTGHQPAVDELVGFFVTSGDARHGDSGVGLHERSNIVAVKFPTAAGGVFNFAADDVVVDPPVVQPPAPPVVDPPVVQPPAPPVVPIEAYEFLRQLLSDGEHLIAAVEEIANQITELRAELATLNGNGIKVRL